MRLLRATAGSSCDWIPAITVICQLTMNPIKLYRVTLVVRLKEAMEYHAAEVLAKHPTTAIRLGVDFAARRHRVRSGLVEATELLLMRTTKSKVEKVNLYQ